MKINNKNIKQFAKPSLIAEIGVNHNGSISLAREMIDAAVEAGADAVKFQTFNVDDLLIRSAVKAHYQTKTTGHYETQYEMLSRCALTATECLELHNYCVQKGIQFISSPFDLGSVSFLSSLGLETVKIPSGEITNIPYLTEIAKSNWSIILSTGMSNLGEVELALNTLYDGGAENICLLHCVSDYPASAESMNLRAIQTLHKCFDLPVGLSDHTTGQVAAVVSVAFGAPLIEKHFTLDKRMDGPDHQASMEPSDFSKLRTEIEEAFSVLGNGVKRIMPTEINTREVARKSVVLKTDVKKGVRIETDMLALKRPGIGIKPVELGYVIGRVASRDLSADTMLKFEDLD